MQGTRTQRTAGNSFFYSYTLSQRRLRIALLVHAWLLSRNSGGEWTNNNPKHAHTHPQNEARVRRNDRTTTLLLAKRKASTTTPPLVNSHQPPPPSPTSTPSLLRACGILREPSPSSPRTPVPCSRAPTTELLRNRRTCSVSSPRLRPMPVVASLLLAPAIVMTAARA